jgi:hypothetical protein
MKSNNINQSGLGYLGTGRRIGMVQRSAGQLSSPKPLGLGENGFGS